MNRYRIELCEVGHQVPTEYLAAAECAGDAVAVVMRSAPYSDNCTLRVRLDASNTDDKPADFDTLRATVIR